MAHWGIKECQDRLDGWVLISRKGIFSYLRTTTYQAKRRYTCTQKESRERGERALSLKRRHTCKKQESRERAELSLSLNYERERAERALSFNYEYYYQVQRRQTCTQQESRALTFQASITHLLGCHTYCTYVQEAMLL